jgi:TadE-like protein
VLGPASPVDERTTGGVAPRGVGGPGGARAGWTGPRDSLPREGAPSILRFKVSSNGSREKQGSLCARPGEACHVIGSAFRSGNDKDDDGASLVEFALILPVFMMLVLGAFSGASTYNTKVSMTSAAREGARYGATLAAIPSGGTPWANAVRDVVVQRSGGELTNNQVCVALVQGPGTSPTVSPAGTPPQTYYWLGSIGPASGPCFVDNSSDAGQRVQIRVKKTGHIEALLFKVSPTLTSSAVARYEAAK